VVTDGWVTVCGQVNHLCVTNTKVNLAFHPSGIGKSITSLSVCGHSEARSPVSGDSNNVSFHMAGDAS